MLERIINRVRAMWPIVSMAAALWITLIIGLMLKFAGVERVSHPVSLAVPVVIWVLVLAAPRVYNRRRASAE